MSKVKTLKESEDFPNIYLEDLTEELSKLLIEYVYDYLKPSYTKYKILLQYKILLYSDIRQVYFLGLPARYLSETPCVKLPPNKLKEFFELNTLLGISLYEYIKNNKDSLELHVFEF